MTMDAIYEEHGSDWSHQVSAVGTTQWLQRDHSSSLCEGCGLRDYSKYYHNTYARTRCLSSEPVILLSLCIIRRSHSSTLYLPGCILKSVRAFQLKPTTQHNTYRHSLFHCARIYPGISVQAQWLWCIQLWYQTQAILQATSLHAPVAISRDLRCLGVL